MNADGTPSNQHALEHYNQTKHPITVKLGTISDQGYGGLALLFILYLNIEPNFSLSLSLSNLLLIPRCELLHL